MSSQKILTFRLIMIELTNILLISYILGFEIVKSLFYRGPNVLFTRSQYFQIDKLTFTKQSTTRSLPKSTVLK